MPTAPDVWEWDLFNGMKLVPPVQIRPAILAEG
jgi:hypothetical protein